MPIASSSILFHYSNATAASGYGDSSNPTSAANAAANCRGRFVSTGVWGGGSPNDLFENINGDDNAGRAVDYRCLFVRNADPSRTLFGSVVWIPDQTAGGADCAVGVDPTAVSLIGSSSPQAIAVPLTHSAPQGVSFFAAATKAAGVSLGNIPPGSCRAFWVRRSAQDTPPLDVDGVTVRVEGDSEA